MTLLITNGGYVFLIRLDLIFFMSLWKEFKSFQTLKDFLNKNLIELILYEKDVKLLKFKRSSGVGLMMIAGPRGCWLWLLHS